MLFKNDDMFLFLKKGKNEKNYLSCDVFDVSFLCLSFYGMPKEREEGISHGTRHIRILFGSERRGFGQ